MSLREASERALDRSMIRSNREIIRWFAGETAKAIEQAAPAGCTDPWCGRGGCPHYREWLRSLADADLVRAAAGLEPAHGALLGAGPAEPEQAR